MKFIDKFLISPVQESLFTSSIIDTDQLRFEKRLREEVAKRNLAYPEIKDYSSWKYYYTHGSSYVDTSTFYSELTYVSFSAITTILSSNKQKLDIVVWTYGAITIFLNGKSILEDDIPVYKPIKMHRLSIDLEKGTNELFIVFQNLGVRDTRNLFGISYSADDVEFHVPAHLEDEERAKWLDGITLKKNVLFFPSARNDVQVGFDSASPDYGKVKERYRWFDISSDVCKYVVESGNPYLLVKCGELKRRFEIADFVFPDYPNTKDFDSNYKRMLSVIASAEGLSRGDKFGFYIQNILARKALGIENKNDLAYFYETLDQIERRFDCSDFLVSGVIRYLKNYSVDSALKARIDDVLLNYRYWMTMKGSDAMCFWSENHSLLFYSCAMLVGAMYPDSYFPRAQMSGRELEEFGTRLTLEWFDDLDEYGFEEFLSTVYMNVTFAGLLNIIDYAKPEISQRAIKVTDLMLKELSMHTFQGSIIAPMGRVYRGVINPFKQGAQALMNLVNPNNPTSFGEGWLSYFATSSYKIPNGLISLMNEDIDREYSTGDALVVLRKRHDYVITSVQSPRLDGFKRWHNVTLDKDVDKFKNTHIYTKSFNERFHGTTYFEPGTFGYQQHMWSIAISNEALIFANNPGDSTDSTSMRPGYWYGNGIMPAIRQHENYLAAIYVLDDDYPIQFTHLYIPSCKFDTIRKENNWIFMKKNNGFAGIWCNCQLELYNDELSDCELRAYGKKSAYFAIVGSSQEYGSFEAFIEDSMKKEPRFDESSNVFYIGNQLFTRFIKSSDRTQYI